MKLYIPEIGDSFRLTADWKFGLQNEDRNQSLMEYLQDPRQVTYSRNQTSVDVVIPAGEILKIDRVYIRRGASEFSSVTFFWTGKRTKSRMDTYGWSNKEYKVPARPVRFWAKLEDVNKIEFEHIIP